MIMYLLFGNMKFKFNIRDLFRNENDEIFEIIRRNFVEKAPRYEVKQISPKVLIDTTIHTEQYLNSFKRYVPSK